ncbi:MAG: hypothetical protein KA297_14750 [Kofleriaceae bacterium]|nr:hypothetical protein [Kofleriaceae bacterium]
MKTVTTSLALSMTMLLGSAALTRPARADAPAPIVDATVTSVIFDAGTGTRAVAGDTGEAGGAYLGVERIASGRATGQLWLDQIALGTTMVPTRQFRNIRLTGLRGTSLTFEAQPRLKGARDVIQCSAVLQMKRGQVAIDRASCAWKGPVPAPVTPTIQAPPVAPPPPSRPVADLATIGRACKAAFDFEQNQRRCVDFAVAMFEQSRWARSTMSTIAACGDGFAHEDHGLWCLESASRATREPAQLVRYCTQQESFPSEQKACLSKYVTAP